MDTAVPALTLDMVWTNAWRVFKARWMDLIIVFVASIVVGIMSMMAFWFAAVFLQVALAGIIAVVTGLLPSSVVSAVGGVAMAGSLVVFLGYFPLVLVTQIWVFVGAIQCNLDIVRGKDLDFNRFRVSFSTVIKATVCGSLVGLGQFLGMMMFILPGIWFLLITIFWGMVIADQELGPVASIKESMRLMRGEVVFLFLFLLSSLAVMVAGILMCCVGLPVAMVLCMVGQFVIYDTLVRQKGTAANPTVLA